MEVIQPGQSKGERVSFDGQSSQFPPIVVSPDLMDGLDADKSVGHVPAMLKKPIPSCCQKAPGQVVPVVQTSSVLQQGNGALKMWR